MIRAPAGLGIIEKRQNLTANQPRARLANCLYGPYRTNETVSLVYDERHRRVLEQLLLHGILSFEKLQSLANLRRSDDDFGLVMGDLAERRGKKSPRKPVEWWPDKDTRLYAVKPDVLAKMAVK